MPTLRTTLCLLALYVTLTLPAQPILWEALPPMPERVSNNSLAVAEVDGVPHVFSFAGIDTSKDWFGIHLRSFRFNTMTELWDTIPPLPDPNGGKIATAASTVKNKIYIIGGYHVASNYSETSSSKVHIYDPETNTYLPDGADLPIPIDDQVQAVWRDSLIFIITGWSNTTNVANVQIYNPAEDTWLAGTPVPNNSDWKVFGGSGVIIGDTLYYAGGAKSVGLFGPTQWFRKGYINPNNPTEISWEGFQEPQARGYRMAAGVFEGRAIWLGGSDVTYNFDGIAYNGTGGVPALGRITFYDPGTGKIDQLEQAIPPIMDLRGLARIAPNRYIIAGGMESGQRVTDQVLMITIEALVDAKTTEPVTSSIRLFPNPATDRLFIDYPYEATLEIYDGTGRLVRRAYLNPSVGGIDISNLPEGIYFVQLKEGQHLLGARKFVISK